MTPVLQDIALGVGIVGGVVALLKYVWGGGEKKATIEQSITTGFAAIKQEVSSAIAEVKTSVATMGERVGGQIEGLRTRMDRFEQRAETESKERAAATAVENERRTREAAEDAQRAERARSVEAQVAELGKRVDEHEKVDDGVHAELRDRLTRLEGTVDRQGKEQDKLAKKSHDTANDVQTIELRLARIEKTSGSLPAVRVIDPRREDG